MRECADVMAKHTKTGRLLPWLPNDRQQAFVDHAENRKS